MGLQVEERTPLLIVNAKKEASAVAEEMIDKVDKVANPVLELIAPRRVRFSSLIVCQQ